MKSSQFTSVHSSPKPGPLSPCHQPQTGKIRIKNIFDHQFGNWQPILNKFYLFDKLSLDAWLRDEGDLSVRGFDWTGGLGTDFVEALGPFGRGIHDPVGSSEKKQEQQQQQQNQRRMISESLPVGPVGEGPPGEHYCLDQGQNEGTLHYAASDAGNHDWRFCNKIWWINKYKKY